MKIAAISITYNDDYKFNEWYSHYLEHKDEFYMHIIVDNHSDETYLNKVKETFTSSHIIERTTNGGCTGAYNDGIRFALSNKDVDSIMLIGNDIRLEKGASTLLHNFLFSDNNLGMIAPIIISKDQITIEDFGCKISDSLIMLPKYQGKKIDSIQKETNYCQALTGGMNLAKREFYEKVGLQDENLFMYSDEVDMGHRQSVC
ncbi:MAG: hypothetical protein C4K58_01565 [Flavobacteriaceae bacterium]|nr:MAG: hypothetical protein C4K58_01565 [Flavobacteriaceae bacterium]